MKPHFKRDVYGNQITRSNSLFSSAFTMFKNYVHCWTQTSDFRSWMVSVARDELHRTITPRTRGIRVACILRRFCILFETTVSSLEHGNKKNCLMSYWMPSSVTTDPHTRVPRCTGNKTAGYVELSNLTVRVIPTRCVLVGFTSSSNSRRTDYIPTVTHRLTFTTMILLVLYIY